MPIAKDNQQPSATQLNAIFNNRETEFNWQPMVNLLKQITDNLHSYTHAQLLDFIENTTDAIMACMSSERTRLVLCVFEFIQRVALSLNHQLVIVQTIWIDGLLKQCERSSRLLAERSKTALILLLKACPLPARSLILKMTELFHESSNRFLRLCICDAIHIIIAAPLPTEHPDRLFIQSAECNQLFRSFLEAALQDASEPVRASSRIFFEAVVVIHSDLLSITDTLPSAIQKALRSQCASVSQPDTPQKSTVSSIRSFVVQQRQSNATSSSLRSKPLRIQHSSSTASTSASSSHSTLPKRSSSASPVADQFSVAQEKTPIAVQKTLSPSTLVKEFIQSVKSNEWSSRCNALHEFTNALLSNESAQIVASVSESPLAVIRLFDIFISGLLDVHHPVIAADIAFGHTLINAIAPELLIGSKDACTFAQLAVLRLLAVIHNVQFSKRHDLIHDAESLVQSILRWAKVNPPPTMIDSNVDALQKWHAIQVLSFASQRSELPIYIKVKPHLLDLILNCINAQLPFPLNQTVDAKTHHLIYRIGATLSEDSCHTKALECLYCIHQVSGIAPAAIAANVPVTHRQIVSDFFDQKLSSSSMELSDFHELENLVADTDQMTITPVAAKRTEDRLAMNNQSTPVNMVRVDPEVCVLRHHLQGPNLDVTISDVPRSDSMPNPSTLLANDDSLQSFAIDSSTSNDVSIL